jgi:hypothetical protein
MLYQDESVGVLQSVPQTLFATDTGDNGDLLCLVPFASFDMLEIFCFLEFRDPACRCSTYATPGDVYACGLPAMCASRGSNYLKP